VVQWSCCTVHGRRHNWLLGNTSAFLSAPPPPQPHPPPKTAPPKKQSKRSRTLQGASPPLSPPHHAVWWLCQQPSSNQQVVGQVTLQLPAVQTQTSHTQVTHKSHLLLLIVLLGMCFTCKLAHKLFTCEGNSVIKSCQRLTNYIHRQCQGKHATAILL
jgi:hypothetical protein